MKWESTRYKPYTWCTILDALSAPIVDHKLLADDIATTLTTRATTSHKPTTECDSIDNASVIVNYTIASEVSRLKMNFTKLSHEAKGALQMVPLHELEAVIRDTLEDQYSVQSHTYEALFQDIMNHCCYLNYLLLRNVVDTFLTDDPLNDKFKKYSTEVEQFMDSTTLENLKLQVMGQIQAGKRQVELKLSSRWTKVTIKQFKQLLNVLFHSKHLTHMTVTEGCLCVTWTATNTTSKIVKNKAYDTEFMMAIGVLHLTVGDTVIYETKEQDTSQTLDEALVTAVESGPISAVELLLAVGSNSKQLLLSGDTVISRAANAKDNDGRTVLYHACFWDHLDVVRLLLHANADPNIASNKASTPLSIASYNGYNEIVELLVDAKADVDDQNNNGMTAIYAASQQGHVKVVETLINANADLSLSTTFGTNPLMMATYNGHNDIVQLLVGTKVDVNARNNNGETALCIASRQGNVEVVAALINANADPSIAEYNGATPLMAASYHGYNNIVELLVNAKVDVNAQDNDGLTALFVASQNGHIKVISTLLKSNADPSIARNDGSTSLTIASCYGYCDIAQLLLDADADVNAQNSKGITALYAACQGGHIKIVDMLINANADPSIPTNNGYTPLMAATIKRHKDIVELLVSTNTNVNLCAKNGITALHYACATQQSNIVDIFLHSNANPNLVAHDGSTPLMKASSVGDIDTVLLLLQHNADINYSTVTGETALLLATDNNIFQILLDHGASIERRPQPPPPVSQERWILCHRPPLPTTDEPDVNKKNVGSNNTPFSKYTVQ